MPLKVLLVGLGRWGQVHLKTWKQLASVQALSSGVMSVAFDPSGSELVATDAEGNTGIWTVPGLQQVGTALAAPFKAHYAIYSPTTAAFAVNGTTVVVVQEDGEAIAWPARVGAWERAACVIAGRNLSPAEWGQYLGNRPYRTTCRAGP